MINWFLALAILLMIAGIAGSLHPSLPGPLFSIAGVMLYWWSTGYSSPGVAVFIILVLTGLLAVGLDSLAGYLGVEKSGASRKTAYIAAIASFLLFFVAGPFGVIIGTAGVILARELMLGKDFDKALRSAVYSSVAMLASVVAKAALTSLMLLIFLIAVLL